MSRKSHPPELVLQIVELTIQGKKNNEICHQTGLSSTTVHDIVERYTKKVRVLRKKLPDDCQLTFNFKGEPGAKSTP